VYDRGTLIHVSRIIEKEGTETNGKWNAGKGSWKITANLISQKGRLYDTYRK